MKKKDGNEFLTKMQRSVPKKVRGELEQAYNNADKSKKERVNCLSMAKIRFNGSFTGWVSVLSTLLSGLLILINVILFSVVCPQKVANYQYAYELYEKTGALYDYSQNNGGIDGQGELSFGELDKLFIANDVAYKQAVTDFDKAVKDCEDAFDGYTAKLEEYEANLKYVNDKINNYEKYLIDHNEANAEANAKKIEEYEQKRDGLAELKSQCEALADGYYTKLTNKTNGKIVLNDKISALHEYYPLEYKVKMTDILSAKTGVVRGFTSALNELGMYLNNYNSAANKCVTLYNSSAQTVKEIEKIDEKVEGYGTVYAAFVADPERYLKENSVEIFNRYDAANEEYGRLNKAYENASDNDKAAAETQLNTYMKDVYAPAKTVYDRNEEILGYFGLNGYALLSQKDNKTQDDLKAIKEKEELVKAYARVKGWQVADYDAAAAAPNENETAKADKKAYEGWFNGVCAVDNKLYGFSADRTRFSESLKVNAYDDVYAKGEMASSYYTMEGVCTWLKLRSNDLVTLAENVNNEFDEIGKNANMGILNPDSRKDVLARLGFGEAANSINSWVNSCTGYDLTVDGFKPFDYNGYHVTVDDKGEAKIPEAQAVSKSVNDLIAEFGAKLESYNNQMNKIKSVSENAISYANSNSDGFDFIRILMIPYNALVSLILLLYFIGVIVLSVDEAKQQNYKTIAAALREE